MAVFVVTLASGKKDVRVLTGLQRCSRLFRKKAGGRDTTASVDWALEKERLEEAQPPAFVSAVEVVVTQAEELLGVAQWVMAVVPLWKARVAHKQTCIVCTLYVSRRTSGHANVPIGLLAFLKWSHDNHPAEPFPILTYPLQPQHCVLMRSPTVQRDLTNHYDAKSDGICTLLSSTHRDIAGFPGGTRERIQRHYPIWTQLLTTARAHHFDFLAEFGPDEKTRKTMSAKKRAIGDTEDEFQAALATYTKAGNKTIAMRRLWNAAYEIGRAAAPVIWVADTATARERESERVEQARQTAFEEGRQAGEKDALTMDGFEVSFSAGKMDGIATGVELGRQEETQ
ncbi:hypothetical protein FB451DRAFT_1167176 [Mycena latifolia]|nr:hypothetical protein FB451DRAFT_1167176 [Mycena latifolia]